MDATARRPCAIDIAEDLVLARTPLGSVASHAHAAPAILVGLDGPFSFVSQERTWQARALYVPAGFSHGLECGTRTMMVIYAPGQRRRAPGPVDRGPWLDAVADAVLRRADGDDDLASLRSVVCSADERLDPRVSKALALIKRAAQTAAPIEDIAEEVGLSSTRLMKLLQRDLGVPFRRLRTWERMRSVTLARSAGQNLTTACHAAGFADSAHFSRTFRQLFGIPPSAVLHPAASIRIWPDQRC